MIEPDELSVVAVEFRQHFDQYYLGVIPRLLNEEGMMLAFISLLTAIECLAGLFQPQKGTGERFQDFIKVFFSMPYHTIAADMWQFRNLMVHAFNPMPFQIGCHHSRMHLVDIEGSRYLNAEDLYADLVLASRAYFFQLYEDPKLQANFAKRISEKGGGRLVKVTVTESVPLSGPAV